VFRAAIALGFLALAPLHAPLADELPLKDPMRPYAQAEPQGPRDTGPRRPRLSAVLISSERRLAVIDGKFYREGEEVGDARLMRIEADAVHLRRGTEDFEVRLRAGDRPPQVTRGDSAS
jgi:hypothetical protein